MMIDLVARSPEGLYDINNVLHDRWFRVIDVAYDKTGQRVSVRFPLSGQDTARLGVSATATALVLEVESVEELQLMESEGVGRYDFNKLMFSTRTDIIRLETGVPLRFDMRVSGLGVRLFERAPPDDRASLRP